MSFRLGRLPSKALQEDTVINFIQLLRNLVNMVPRCYIVGKLCFLIVLLKQNCSYMYLPRVEEMPGNFLFSITFMIPSGPGEMEGIVAAVSLFCLVMMLLCFCKEVV